MKATDKAKLIERIKTLEGLTDDERAALLGLLSENKTYGLVWEDKPEKVEERLRNELPVLKEVKSRAIIQESGGGNSLIHKDIPNHVIIEGDNLEALSTLAYTHEGKIDVIYIDPPYNTGNKDFIYNDAYVDREDIFRHSQWLSFISKRLKIAKRLLSENGLIFISIDDNEQGRLKVLCDEIFLEKNFLAQLVWKSKSGGANDTSAFGVDHEYILCYAHNSTLARINKDKEAVVTTAYNKVDSDGRRYSLDRLDKQSLGYQPSLDFPIEGPDGRTYVVEHKDPAHKKARWRWGKDTVEERFNELVFIWPYVYTKNYEKSDGQKPRSILFEERFGRTRTGSTDLKAVLCNQNIFTYPKPINLLKYLCGLGTSKTSTILDFFAGSGTTLHAVMQLNAEDGGHRQCILCTNNENGICENVTYERNKRVIQGYTKPNGEKVEGLKDNNLRYYRTDYVGRSRTMRNMHALVNMSTDMLCIKEDLYTEQKRMGGAKSHPQIFRFFDDGRRQMLIIYREEYIEEIVGIIEKMDVAQPMKVYVFSPSENPNSELFESVADKVELTALPAAIYNTYKRILPKRKPQLLDGISKEEDAEASEDVSTVDFGGLFGEGGEE